MHPNVVFAWCWILVGLLTGAGIGLCFHGVDWLGGYGSWPRRLVRLGHISFLGTGLLNLGFGLSVQMCGLASQVQFAPAAFVVGAVTMPTVCFLSAWRPGFRQLFFVPVGSLLLATGEMVFVSVSV